MHFDHSSSMCNNKDLVALCIYEGLSMLIELRFSIVMALQISHVIVINHSLYMASLLFVFASLSMTI